MLIKFEMTDAQSGGKCYTPCPHGVTGYNESIVMVYSFTCQGCSNFDGRYSWSEINCKCGEKWT